MGHKAGDNSQVQALADSLGWPCEIKRFVYHPYELITNRLLGATLAGVDRKKSSNLEAPWPDLVITAGRRNEPVARWIARQAGGKVRLVHIGRPWASPGYFDLIISTPQYQLEEYPNVISNSLPLHGITDSRLAAAKALWEPRLRHLQRPYCAVLIGGNSGPFVFTADKGERMGLALNTLVREIGGTALITDSARTPADFLDAFTARYELPAYIHRWVPGGEDNPYVAYLALADSIVVTGESMSMLTEASATRKPLYIFDPGDDLSCNRCREQAGWWRYRHNFRFKPLSHRIAMHIGPRRMRRDVGAIQDAMVKSGRAVWLGSPFPAGLQIPPAGDLERATAGVKALFGRTEDRIPAGDS